MTAVLGGDRDEVLAAIAKHGLTAGQRQRPRPDRRRRHRSSSSPPSPTTPPAKARLIPLIGRRRVPHRAHGARPSRCSAPCPGRCPPTTPRTPLISNRDGQVVHDGREVLKRHRHPDQQPGPLGPLHGDDARPRRHRPAGDAAGGHPDRDRQARAEGRRDLRAQDPRPARRRPRVHRQARRRLADRLQPDLADAGRPRQGHLPPDRRACAEGAQLARPTPSVGVVQQPRRTRRR